MLIYTQVATSTGPRRTMAAGTQRARARRCDRPGRDVTTVPNQLCAEIHNRMPVILKPDAWPAWLGEEPADEPELKALLAPYPADDMICWPVSARVGNVRNNDSSLIEPVAAA